MKVPPYGKPLKALLEQGKLPNNSVYLYIGQKSWDKGQLSYISRPTRTLILPPNHSPFLYEWPVNGCDILMIETSPFDAEYIEQFANLLFSHGAIKIVLISMNLLSTTYERDF